MRLRMGGRFSAILGTAGTFLGGESRRNDGVLAAGALLEVLPDDQCESVWSGPVAMRTCHPMVSWVSI